MGAQWLSGRVLDLRPKGALVGTVNSELLSAKSSNVQYPSHLQITSLILPPLIHQLISSTVLLGKFLLLYSNNTGAPVSHNTSGLQFSPIDFTTLSLVFGNLSWI